MNTEKRITSKPHYFYSIRMLIEFYNAGELPNVSSIKVEPEYGRVAHIRYRDGSVRIFCGSGLGVNPHGAATLAKDKGYSKYFLNRLGYATPVGKVFLMPKWVKTIDNNLSIYGARDYPTIHEISAYISDTLHYPCFLKPNDGAKGRGVHKCFQEKDVHSALEEYEQDGLDVLLVEECIDLPMYRVDVCDDRIVCGYLRKPLSVTGDGKKTIQELLLQKREHFKQAGRPAVIQPDDPRIAKRLKRLELDFDSVPAAHEELALHDFSNLPSGGNVEDCTENIHPHWESFCIKLAKDMGLRLCGIDILCEDLKNPDAEYRILEINSAPALENYAALGEKQNRRVQELYRKLFNERNLP